MKKNLGNVWLWLALALLSVNVVSCKDDDDSDTPEEEGYVYTPKDFAYVLTDANTVSFSWGANSATAADIYVFELYKGEDANSTAIVSEEVDAATMAYSYAETLVSGADYYARVKGAVADGSLDDSDWSTLSFAANVLDISEDFQTGDITSSSVTIRWEADGGATSIVVYDEAEEEVATHEVTDEEDAAGAATVSDLTANTTYTAKLYQGEGVVGEYEFTTEIEGGVAVTSDSELADAVANASDGDIIILETTETTSYTLTDVTLPTANITIRGRSESAIPTLKLNAALPEYFTGLKLMYLVIDGNNELTNMLTLADCSSTCDASVFQVWETQTAGGDVSIVDCEIYNYTRVFYAPKESYQTVANLTIEGTIIGNITGNIIDTRLWSESGVCDASLGDGSGNPFRGSAILNTVIDKSTIYNCANDGESALIRFDDTSLGIGQEVAITISNSTIYSVGASYMLYNTPYSKLDTEGEITVSGCLFAEISDCVTSNSDKVQKSLYNEGNEYSNAVSLTTDDTYTKRNSKTVFDSTGTTVTATFTDAANGDFTVSGATVGDPRWLQ